MAAARTWTDRDDDTLIAAHADGDSITAIAKRMQRSASTVSKHGKRLGLSWDRARTAAATAAVIADGRARRAALEQRMLDEAERSLDRMWSGLEVGAFAGADGEFKHAWIEEPSPADRKAIMQTAATAATAAAKLAEQNAGTEIDTAKAALTLMQQALEDAHPTP